MISRFRKKIARDAAQEGRGSVHSQPSDSLQIPSDLTNEEQQMFALQAKLNDEIILETACTFGSKTRYLVVSKYSIRLYKSKKNWLKKRDSPLLTLLVHDSYAMSPEIPLKNTLHIRTTDAIVPIKMMDEDAVDQCIALINAHASSRPSHEARLHYWKGKFTVHVYVTEGWELPLLDSGTLSDPYIQIRMVPKDSGKLDRRRPGEIDNIVYLDRIRDGEKNPVFSEQFTFLCANPTDYLLIEIFDYDQWVKKELIGCIRIDLSMHLDHGIHGWFPILDGNETARPGRGYLHMKIAILDATQSIDHMSMSGANFNSSRQVHLQQLSESDPILPISQRISVFVGSWNVGNEPPPNDLSLWIVRDTDALAHVQQVPLRKSFRAPDATTLRHKKSDSSMDAFVLLTASSSMAQQHKKTESDESLGSIYNLDMGVELGSLNELRIRSQRPRMCVKSGRYVSRSKYDRSPIEVSAPPGLYVIGTQECQYTPKGGSTSNSKEDWIKLLSDHLGEEYVQVEYSSLWQIRLAIFARKEIAQHISNVNVHKEATGIGHVLGNKGGVIISFRLYHAFVCFVNCHLAAHQTKHEQRNQDIRDIITKSSVKIGNKQSDLANQFHYIWFMGDLNYRLDYGVQAQSKSPSIQEFREMECLIQAGRFNILFNFDQLTRDMQKKEIMTGWSEGIYDFPPTFKVERNAGFKYNPIRSPAWCDRILWKSFFLDDDQYPDPIEQTSMKVCESIATSDHKPISSLFEIDVFFLEESRDASRGRAELLFTEVALAFSDLVPPANPAQYHLRFRSDCFLQNPITQALVEPSVRHLSPTNAMILPGSGPAEVSSPPQVVDGDWMSAPLHPIIKLKHNNLGRLRQHIISVELLHSSGAVSAQGHMTFHMFNMPEAQIRPTRSSLSGQFDAPADHHPVDAAVSVQAETCVASSDANSKASSPLSSVSMKGGTTPIASTDPNSSRAALTPLSSVSMKGGTTPIASTDPNSSRAALTPLSSVPMQGGTTTPIASTDANSSRALSPPASVSMQGGMPRKLSQMVIRPSSGRESARRSSRIESLARKSVSQIVLSQRVTETSRPLNVEVGSSSSRRTSSMKPIEQVATVQSNVPFSCELSIGTSYVGSLSGAVRLSWALNTP